MKSLSHKVQILFLCLFVFVGMSCGGGSETSDNTAGEPVATVGVTVLTMTHPFFIDLVDELKAEAVRNNIEVVLVSSEFDVAMQKNQMSDFIVQQVDAIILCPSDSKAIGTSIKEANGDSLENMTIERAIELIEEKREIDRNKMIKTFPEDENMELLNGRYGPYLKIGRKNYRLPKDVEPKDLTYEECVEIAANQDKNKKTKKKKK